MAKPKLSDSWKEYRRSEMTHDILKAIKAKNPNIKGTLDYLIVHCSLTPLSMWIDKAWLHKIHIIENGWSRYGYSDLIRTDGSIENITPYDEDIFVENDEMTWGAAGFNSKSRHICVAGGLDKNKHNADTLTEAQGKTLAALLHRTISFHPHILIAGHYDFNPHKTCPNFDVQRFCLLNNIPEKNIYRKS